MSLQGKVALVTGASRGIGQAIALELGRQGAIVIGTATSASGAERIAETLKANGVEGAGLVLDVSNDESVATTLEHIQQHLGQPLILVNNAGITRDNLMLRMKDDEWHDVINTNLNSLFNVTHHVAAKMGERGWGRIVNISSVNGVKGQAGQTNYSAAKAGVIGFTKALAQEFAAKGVTVNAIAPGYVATKMVTAIREDILKGIIDSVPMKRLAKPEEIGAAVVYLTSELAGFVTGATLNINGGLYYQ